MAKSNEASKFKQYRAFLILLVLVGGAWIITKMSEERSYTVDLPIEYTGLDTSRYIVMRLDSTLSIAVEGDGFSEMWHHHKWHNKRIPIAIGKPSKESYGTYIYNIPTDSYLHDIEQQFASAGKYRIVKMDNLLSLELRERQCKAYKPKLKDVNIVFDDRCGLRGDPQFEPDSIYLYGSEESLGKIADIYTKPTKIKVSGANGRYKLDLDPVWKNYPDLRCSTDKVTLKIPVEAYTEKDFTTDVAFRCSDTTTKVKLYPNKVVVKAWVPQSRFASIEEKEIKAEVTYEEGSTSKELVVNIVDFPSDIRIKTVEPEKIQYVIIGNK